MSGKAAMRKHETLFYIHEMLDELKRMSTVEKQDMLVFLIEMAQIEASDALRSHEDVSGNMPGWMKTAAPTC